MLRLAVLVSMLMGLGSDRLATRAQVVITEVLAVNAGSWLDADKNPSSWVELHNPGTDPVNLAGWSLRLDGKKARSWRFPSSTLPPGGFLVVACSGKSRSDPAHELHASFLLKAKGGTVILSNAASEQVSVLEYGPQHVDVSFGLEGDRRVYFRPPSPGKANVHGAPGVAARPRLSIDNAVFRDRVSVEITAPAAAAAETKVRYTFDGSEPTEEAPLAPTRLEVTEHTELRVRTFSPGLLPSHEVTGSYAKLAPSALEFAGDLPLVLINTFGRKIRDKKELSGHFHVIDRIPERGTTLDASPCFTGRCAIKHRGSSTLHRPKKAYRVELRDDLGEDLPATLLGMPADSDWILYAAYNWDYSHLRNVLTFELARRLGVGASRTRFVEVFVNPTQGPVTREHYVGLYVLMENIKRASHRVDIKALRPEDSEEPDLAGGYIVKVDRPGPGEVGFAAGGEKLKYVYPKERSITNPQRKWIQGWMDRFGTALKSPEFADPSVGYAKFIDVDNFIDFHFLNEYVKNPDAYTLSTFMHLDRGKKLRMGPVWDYDRAMRTNTGEHWVGRAADPWGWTGDCYHAWWGLLFRDPAFRTRYRARGRAILADQLRIDRVHAAIDGLAAEITAAQDRNQVRWPFLHPGGWHDDIILLKTWLTDRDKWFRAELLEIPEFSSDTGAFVPPFRLSMRHENLSGDIYYALGGYDPRLNNGELSPFAKRYEGSVAIDSDTRARARVKVGDVWSRITQDGFARSLRTLAITEIMYNPPGGREFEFVEIHNWGDAPVDLRNVTLGDEIRFNFSLGSVQVLAPGGYAIVVQNLESFKKRYGDIRGVVAGAYVGRLSNTAVDLYLRGPVGEKLAHVHYEDWFSSTDGQGRSLNILDPRQESRTWSTKEQFQPSESVQGSPGRKK